MDQAVRNRAAYSAGLMAIRKVCAKARHQVSATTGASRQSRFSQSKGRRPSAGLSVIAESFLLDPETAIFYHNVAIGPFGPTINEYPTFQSNQRGCSVAAQASPSIRG